MMYGGMFYSNRENQGLLLDVFGFLSLARPFLLVSSQASRHTAYSHHPQLARRFLFHCSPIVLFCVRTRLYALVIFCFSFPSLYPMLRYDVRTDPISLVCFSLSRRISVSLAIRNSNLEPISLLVPLHVISLKESHYNRVRRVIVRQ